MVSPAVIVERWEVDFFFNGDRFPADPSTGTLAEKATKVCVNLTRFRCTHTHMTRGRQITEVGRFPAVSALAAC